MGHKKNRFTYWFDNQMSQGTVALIKLLSIVTVGAVIVIGLLIAAFGFGVGKGIWLSLTHIIDPGTIAGDEGTSMGFILAMLAVTFVGILITSTLTGIICNAIDAKVQDLQRGKSVVVERNHVVILGAAAGLNVLVSEIIEANSNHKNEALVIMDDRDTKDVMDENIRRRFPDTKTTRVITRCGSITDVNDLAVCSLDTCRSIIINADDDARTIKCILAVTRLLKECGNDGAYLTTVIREEENVEPARIAGEGRAEVLNFRSMMSRIIAHTGRSAGLSQVYTELFDSDGSEFYIEEHPDAAGKPFGEINRYFPVSTVIGVEQADGKLLVNPEPDRTILQGEKLILFAEDDGVSHILGPGQVQEDCIIKDGRAPEPEKKNMLILGYSSKLAAILEEEDHYIAKGSEIVVALAPDQDGYREELLGAHYENIHIQVVSCEFTGRQGLESLLKDGETVLVLADQSEEDDDAALEKKDARILMILLQLRHLAQVHNYKISVTSDMLKVENQELAQIARVNDFVVSSNITSLILAQISQTRELKAIFDELLCEAGSEIYVRPAGIYVKAGVPVNFYTVCAACAAKQEVPIGYRTKNPDTGEIRIVTNPPKAQEIRFTDEDALVVLAVD